MDDPNKVLGNNQSIIIYKIIIQIIPTYQHHTII